tara:strand:- start:2856 stop:4319 length:1464 start_codon:yes stop_codon:yes gene_type:complete
MATFTVVFFVMVSILPNNSAASNSTVDDEPFITINTGNGLTFEDVINISGQSNIPAAELLWSINHIHPVDTLLVTDGQIMSSSTFSEVSIADDIYNWEISVPVDGLNCTCTFFISAINNVDLEESSIILFIGQNSHFSVINHIPSFQNIVDNQIKYLSYEIVSPDSNSLNVPEISESFAFKANICQYSGNSCVSESVQVEINHSVQSDGTFLLEIDKTYLAIDDGNWNFEIYLRDSYLRFSNVDEQILTFDTNPPMVEILGTNKTQEMGLEVFSTNIDDGYDSSLVALTWTITEPNGMLRGLIDGEYMSDSSISIQFNQSGEWNISVLAIDSVGYFTKQSHIVYVQNIIPIISLNSSIETSNNKELEFDLDDLWFVDASLTFDTVNDIDELTFTWFLDDEIIHVGKSLSNEQLNKSGNHEIILIVTDNDGDTAQSTIEIMLNSEDDSENGSNIIAIAIILIVVLLASILLMRFRKEEASFNLPKWGK